MSMFNTETGADALAILDGSMFETANETTDRHERERLARELVNRTNTSVEITVSPGATGVWVTAEDYRTGVVGIALSAARRLGQSFHGSSGDREIGFTYFVTDEAVIQELATDLRAAGFGTVTIDRRVAEPKI